MNFLSGLAPIAHWFLRVALAGVFLYHGITKFPNLEGLAEGMGMPIIMIAMLASMETLAGLLILIGGFAKDWMTRLAGLIVAVVMLVAIFMVHLEHGWNSVNMGSGNMGRGMEFQFTLTMIGLYFLAVGNGHQGSATV